PPACGVPPYKFPSTSLLQAPPAAITDKEDELRQRARLIEEKAREFEVEGTVQQIHPGPVVTTFEFKPEAGVKYSRITGLGDDLCLALKAESVRIDRIPGKSTVGMEVPNVQRSFSANWSNRQTTSVRIIGFPSLWERTSPERLSFPIFRRCHISWLLDLRAPARAFPSM